MAAKLVPDSFRAIYERNWAGVHAAANRILRDPSEAEDVAQEIFIALWREPGRFDPSRGPLEPYLKLLARSRALDRWRSLQAAGRARDRFDEAGGGRPAALESPETAAVRADERALLGHGLRRLPPAQREAVALAFYGDMSASEIARQTAVPLGTAKSRVRLGVAKLEELCHTSALRAA